MLTIGNKILEFDAKHFYLTMLSLPKYFKRMSDPLSEDSLEADIYNVTRSDTWEPPRMWLAKPNLIYEHLF